MKDYGLDFNNIVGTWPSVEGKNVSAPALFDGTAFNKTFIDDLWGFNQALMLYANDMRPSGISETATVSQRLEAMKHAFGAPGEGVIWWGNEDPAVKGHRILLCEGQTVLIADYPELVEACYVGDANNNDANWFLCNGVFMKWSDPSAPQPGITHYINNAGPYFKLPDARGRFLRDLSNGSGDNPEQSGMKLPGYIQAARSLSHQHWLSMERPGTFYSEPTAVTPTPGAAAWGIANELATASTTFKTTGQIDSSDVSIAAQFGTENRPVNVACRFGIRY